MEPALVPTLLLLPGRDRLLARYFPMITQNAEDFSRIGMFGNFCIFAS